MRLPTAICGSLALTLVTATLTAQQDPISIDPRLHHLGDTNLPTWDPEVPAKPEGLSLDIEFEARRNKGEHVLAITHQDVDNPWPVRINGKKVVVLRRGKPRRRIHYLLPPGTLKNGKNRLFIKCNKKTDDIIIGKIVLHTQPLRQVLRLQPVQVKVKDKDGNPLPAKVTITDKQGKPVEHYYGAALMTAVRPGIAYTGNGTVTFELPPGDYLLWASRGTEWGLDKREIQVTAAKPGKAPVGPIRMSIAREVDTKGFVAADTHIHTYTHSGHGDSSVEERMVTLAAEGVELAIATDHNHNIDYRPTQKRMHLHEHFTPVTGNEVTTKVGHFNAFPLDPKDKIPDYKLTDWVKLVHDMRNKGAKVVILNHPRWPQIPTGPFGVFHLNRVTGRLRDQKVLPFDAIELVNTTQLLNDPRYILVDWFALLNHGEKISAVGVSDSHTVGDPVGQGRTYVRSSTDLPGKINVDEACAAFLRGDTTVSLGIFCDVVVNGRHRMGETVATRNRKVQVQLRVASAAWVHPTRASVFLNGIEVAGRDVPRQAGKPTDARLKFDLQLPAHDAHLVCFVVGKGIPHAFWKTMRPYTLAASNPVFLDVDGVGGYVSPHATASKLIRKHGTDAARLRAALAGVDDSVAVQALSIALESYGDREGSDLAARRQARSRLRQLIGEPPARAIFKRFLKSLPKLQKATKNKPKR